MTQIHVSIKSKKNKTFFTLYRCIKMATDTLPAFSIIKPNESTLQIEVGGDSGNDIDKANTLLNAGLGGTRRFQYNNSFSFNDIFTTNSSNCAVGLLVGYFRENYMSFCLLPINLPRQSLSIGESENIYDYQSSIAYALNLYFSKEQTVFIFSPDNPTGKKEILPINHPNMPILQNAIEPPLIWKITRSGQLGLFQNVEVIQNNPSTFPENAIFKFNLINFNTYIAPSGAADIVYGLNNGWFGCGKYVFGFGKIISPGIYADDYESNAQTKENLKRVLYMFRSNQEPYVTNVYEEFSDLCLKISLKNAIASDGSTQCISSKYTIVESSELSRLQVRNVNTNFNITTTYLVGLIYSSPFRKNIFQDGTFSGSNNSALPAINMDPEQPHNIIDIIMYDEFNHTIKAYNMEEDSDYILTVEKIEDPLISFPPAAYHVLDPFYSTNTTHDCAFPYTKISDSIFKSNRPPKDLYNSAISAAYVHFGRIIGF